MGRFVSCALLAAVAFACGGEAGTNPITDPRAPVVATLEITPTADTLVAFGDTAAFSVNATDADGNQLSGVSITWSSSEPTVATVVQSTGIAGDFVFASISTRTWDTCGVTDYGAAGCWGANREGIVGDGTRTQRLSPVRVHGLPQ